MSPYIVKVGDVRDGSAVYPAGSVLPEGIGDASMVEAGAVEWVEPEPEKVAPPAKPVATSPARQRKAVR